MKEGKTARTELLQVRLTIKETEQIHNTFSKSTCRKLSDYVRKKLLDKPISIYTLNQSLDDFMAEMILLRGELNAIGNNYNQVVKKITQFAAIAGDKIMATTQQSTKLLLLKKVEEIKAKISQINDQWLQ